MVVPSLKHELPTPFEDGIQLLVTYQRCECGWGVFMYHVLAGRAADNILNFGRERVI
jgi:hypothetical protein